MFLLDTNVVSELRVGKTRPSTSVRRWAEGVSSSQLFISSITVFELELGALLMERKDPRQGASLRGWVESILKAFSERTLPYGIRAARLCASMHVPNPRSDRDAMIAAVAKEHGYTVVTRNVGDFQDCGVGLLNPWETLS